MPMHARKIQRYERFAHKVLMGGVRGMRRVTRFLRRGETDLPEDPKRILVVKLWGGGGFLCATPAMQALRNHYRGARITLLTVQGLGSLYRSGELFDEVIAWEAETLSALPGAIRQLRDRARGKQFDLAVNLDGTSEMAALLTLVSGAPATTGFVPRGAGSRGYTLAVPIDTGEDAALTFLDLPREMGLTVPAPAPVRPKLTSAETMHAEGVLQNWGLDEHTQLIGINLDTTEELLERGWPAEKYVLLAQAIEEMGGYKTVFLGTPDEDRFVARHVKQMHTKPVNLVGRTSLRQLAAILTKLHLLITSHTGPLQLACTLDIPTLSILRPEKARWFGPPPSERHAMLVRDTDPSVELSIDSVRKVLDDMLDHLADPENPPWL